MVHANIDESLPELEAADLIYAALIFEYVNIRAALDTLKQICSPSGTLAILLQLRKQGMAEVSPSPYTSLGTLNSIMQLVPPQDMLEAAKQRGFSPRAGSTIKLESNKEFCLQVYARSEA